MDILITIWNFISSPYFLSLVAITVSIYTLWDNYFNFKLSIAAGKQSKLFVGTVDEGNIQPIIFMSIAFTNFGGKTSYLDDVKLLVKLISNKTTHLEQEFEALREYNTLLGDAGNIKQTEILPIVVVGKTTEVKKSGSGRVVAGIILIGLGFIFLADRQDTIRNTTEKFEYSKLHFHHTQKGGN